MLFALKQQRRLVICLKNSGKLSLKMNMIWNSLGSLIYLGIQWLLTVLVVRLSTGYDAAGLLALAMAIGNIFIPFANYRMRIYQISDVTHEYSTSEYMGFRCVTIFISFSACMIYALFTCNFEPLGVIALWLIYKGIEAIIDVMHGLDQQNMRMDIIGKSFIFRGIGTLVAFCLGMYFLNSLELSFIFMILVSVILGYVWDYRKSHIFDRIKPVVNKQLVVSLLKRCFLITIANVACSAAITIPRQYLAMSCGEWALGVYASVAAPVAIIQMGGGYIYGPLLGSFATYYENNERKNFFSLFLKTTLGMAAVGIICAVLLELFGPWLLNLLFGNSIGEYSYLILPLVFLAILTAYLWFINDLLITIRNFNGGFIANIIATVIAFTVCLVFVDAFNMNGVSFTGIVAYGVGIIIGFIFIAIQLRRKFSLNNSE